MIYDVPEDMFPGLDVLKSIQMLHNISYRQARIKMIYNSTVDRDLCDVWKSTGHLCINNKKTGKLVLDGFLISERVCSTL